MRMSTKLTVPDDFDEAPAEQRIAFVQEVWDRIATNPVHVPVPEAHRRILEQRLEDYRADSGASQSWADVRNDLLIQLRKT